MKSILGMFVVTLLVLIGCNQKSNKLPTSAKVEIKDGWYAINGEKFFVKAIGYEIGARPGQDPYKDSIVDLPRMRYDLKLLKDAGFNTIRTWSQLSESQLQVVQESGMKIIFGIWIKPEDNYGDSAFMKRSEDLVKKVVAYTKNYDCVISYLILNEPMTDHIHKCGAKATSNMLAVLKGILNTEHQGIPVSISGNAATDDFIDMNLLDYYGYNCYDYGNGQVGTLGMGGFLKWCKNQNQNKHPMIITEFGYSVSDLGQNNYGGNSLEKQKNGVIANYRSILDAGAVGACPFYYADGWWKGGEDSIHNNTAEEWFGFLGYSDLNDSIGTARPVWYALQTYMKALIVTPKNQEIYCTKIPLEFYLDAQVYKIVVKLHDSILYTKTVEKAGYLSDSIIYSPKGIEDAELVFEFFDKTNSIIKTESIFALLSKETVELPAFTIEMTPSDNLDKSKTCQMKINISNLGKFKVEGDVRYNFNYHIGWNPGPEGDISFPKDLKENKEFSFIQKSEIPDNCWVMTASAGVSVVYGKVHLRLHDQKMIFRGNWHEGIAR
jgi:exo-beta-1,3-glucanase (GH17 family)